MLSAMERMSKYMPCTASHLPNLSVSQIPTNLSFSFSLSHSRFVVFVLLQNLSALSVYIDTLIHVYMHTHTSFVCKSQTLDNDL